MLRSESDTIAQMRSEFPRLRFVQKTDDAFSRIVSGALRVVTFGAQSAYMTQYVTTIANTIYLPTTWQRRSEAERVIVLRHEAVHLRQFQRYGLVGMTLVYLFGGLPLGLAWGRARIEWEAYVETLRAHAEAYGIESLDDAAFRSYIVRQFTSGAYGWMWPFPSVITRWMDEASLALRRELSETKEEQA